MKQTLPILAAWLHDIGKFSQRANAPCSTNLEQEYCPDASHRHVLYTDYFIEHVLPLPPELEGERSRLARMASAYLKPSKDAPEELALHKAAWLSSGYDTSKGKADGTNKNPRLESIFTHIRLNGQGFAKDAQPKHYALRPLDVTVGETPPLFPTDDNQGSYKDLYEAFVAELKNQASLPLKQGIRAYLSSLTSLLEKYTWCIPASTDTSQADISLYDHSATTAAITQALLAGDNASSGLLLCGGELSGMQDFIFGTEGQLNKGASKLLRARSLYLQALTRSLWLAILEKLELSPAAKIMDAGGHFVLLLPDTQATRESLAAIHNEAEQWLLTTFQGTLRITFATVALATKDLERPNFRAAFDRFTDALEEAKLRPFAAAFKNGMSTVLTVPYEAYATHGECDWCHAHPASGKLDEMPICDMCRTLIEHVARRLSKANYLVMTHKAQGVPLFNALSLILEETCANEELFKEAVDVVNMRGHSGYSAVPIPSYIPRMTHEEKSRWETEGRRCDEALELNAPKTFAMLAEEARIPLTNKRGFRSIACLAACMADVDNARLLFGVGFDADKGGESYVSLARFAMLSRMMNAFFATYVPHLIQREFPNMYILFAGGDDLFALGPWSETIEFALRLREDFTKFTGNNPAVTLSAGLPLCKPHVTMNTICSAALETLELAKNAGKNAVTLFGVTANWPLFRNLLEIGQWLESLCDKGAITQGFMRRILSYARDCRDFSRKKNADIRKGLYLSRMIYDIKRNCDTNKLSAKDIARITALGQDKDTFPKTELSLSWSIYRMRIR